jgi:CBS domain-containing membrane protein
VGSDDVVIELARRLADVGVHHVPVIDAERRFVGMVSPAHLVAALVRAQLGP